MKTGFLNLVSIPLLTMYYPKDVQRIIEYTELKKKHPELDKSLKSDFGFDKDFLTMNQMSKIFGAMKKVVGEV